MHDNKVWTMSSCLPIDQLAVNHLHLGDKMEKLKSYMNMCGRKAYIKALSEL